MMIKMTIMRTIVISQSVPVLGVYVFVWYVDIIQHNEIIKTIQWNQTSHFCSLALNEIEWNQD